MDHDVTRKRPRKIESRFELAASRMASAWVRAGRISVGPDDLRIARAFLEETGWRVGDLTSGVVRLARRQGGPVRELTPEAVVLLALRQLADRR